MKHFVQYHNPDSFGEFRPSKKQFGIVTDKRINDLLGNTVWLVSRKGKPATYVLCEKFVVERVGSNIGGRLLYFAEASHGQPLDPPKRIDQEPWFELLQQLTGNFTFGLQPINDETVMRG